MRIKLNQIRFVCPDSDRKGIHVKSTLDETYKLDGRTDETISFADDDLVVIKNVMDRPVAITLESVKLPDGRRAVVRPSRQAHFTLLDKGVSEHRSQRQLQLGGGESMTLTSSEWVPQATGGAVFPV